VGKKELFLFLSFLPTKKNNVPKKGRVKIKRRKRNK